MGGREWLADVKVPDAAKWVGRNGACGRRFVTVRVSGTVGAKRGIGFPSCLLSDRMGILSHRVC